MAYIFIDREHPSVSPSAGLCEKFLGEFHCEIIDYCCGKKISILRLILYSK